MKIIDKVKTAGIVVAGMAVLAVGLTGCGKKTEAPPAPAPAEQPAKAPAAAPADEKPKDHPAH